MLPQNAVTAMEKVVLYCFHWLFNSLLNFKPIMMIKNGAMEGPYSSKIKTHFLYTLQHENALFFNISAN